MYETSIEFYEKAIKIRINLLGEEHADVAILYDNIGKYYFLFIKFFFIC